MIRLGANGTMDATFNETIFSTYASNPVIAVVAQTDGKVLLGGSFSIINGSSL